MSKLVHPLIKSNDKERMLRFVKKYGKEKLLEKDSNFDQVNSPPWFYSLLILSF